MKRSINLKILNIKSKLTGNFVVLLLNLSIPVIFQNFMGAGLNLIDNIMIGQLGDHEIAAVGLANQIYFIFALFILGINSGSSIFYSQFWGKNDIKNIRRILGLSLIIVFSTSVVIITGLTLFPSFIMSIFSNDKQVIVYGSAYLRITVISYLFYGISSLYETCLRNTRHPKIPMYINLIGILINIALNYILIFGKFGAPPMGVTGAAIATTIARFFQCFLIILIVYTHKWASSAKLTEMLDFNKNLIKRFFSQSSLLIFKDISWGVGIAILAGIYSRLGTSVIAAVNILNSIQHLTAVFFIGFSSACQIILGNLIGAEKHKLAYIYAKRFIIIAILAGLITSLILYSCRYYILIPYKMSDTVINYLLQLIIVYSFFIPVIMTNMLSVVGILRSGGDTIICIFMDLVALYIISIPVTLFSAFYLQLPIVFIFALSQGQEVIKIVFLFYRFISKKWIKNLTYGFD